MKTLYSVVLLLALVLPGCASSRPVDVVMRDGQRWVTVPEAGVSFPLLGVFDGAEVGDSERSGVFALDASSRVGSDCAIAVASRPATVENGWVMNGERTFNAKAASIVLSRESNSNYTSRAKTNILNSGKCVMVVGTFNPKYRLHGTTAYCYGDNQKLVVVSLGGTESCVSANGPAFTRMMEQMRFE